MAEKNSIPTFIWRITASHMIAYFIAGISAYYLLNYKERYATESLSQLMKPVDSPWIALGPALQIFRGIIIAVVLLPFRDTILNSKNGMLKLAWLILGLSFISTIGPTPGSFEGFIYTILPVSYHLIWIPETVLYIGLFVSILAAWHKYEKRALNIVAAVMVILIILMAVMGYFDALGMLKR